MSVDPVDKAGPVGALAPPDAALPVRGAEAAASTEAAAAVERVRAGDLSLTEYLDLHVARATQHLEGKLGPADLEMVREQLRSELTSDPTALELLREAAGMVPPPREP